MSSDHRINGASRDGSASPAARGGASGGSRREQLQMQLGDEVRAGQRATDVIDDLLAQLLGINRTDGRCLDILDHRGQMSAGELAAESRLTSGAVTAVIDRLEHAGYVHRVADRADRRRVLVELTEKARQAGWELMGKPMLDAGKAAIERYSDKELELLIDFQRLGRQLQERHAEFLREQLRSRETGGARGPAGKTPKERGRRRPGTQTAP